jgi:tRNA G18 (ribose-2'-O)-methylase SpoU
VAWEAHPDAGVLAQQLREEGYRVVCVEQTENSVLLPDYQPAIGERIALFMGNEVEGVSESVLGQCDLALEIPQHGTKHSLNVSVAAGIVLYALLAGQRPG